MSAPIAFHDKEHLVEQLTGELLLFGLLGKLLYENPEQALLKELVEDEVFSEAPFAASRPSVHKGLELLQAWAAEFSADEEAGALDVKADYTRLFVGTVQLPLAPWESVYYSEERLLFQESTMDVRRWYRRFGLEVINLRKEPDDHIGLELVFIAHLAQRALVAYEQGNEVGLRTLLDAQRAFSRKHLLAWAPLWCEQMVEYAHTPFYRGLALVLHGALEELAWHLSLTIPDRSAALKDRTV